MHISITSPSSANQKKYLKKGLIPYRIASTVTFTINYFHELILVFVGDRRSERKKSLGYHTQTI